VPGFTSLDAVLAEPGIRVVGLFSGPVGRAELIRRIIRAGKDVMTTKPFETDPTAARAILDEARTLGRTILLNSPEPEPPSYLSQVLAWQTEFALGRPVACRAESFVPYREQADGRWLDDPLRCPVAPVFRIGIYLIHDVVRVFGRVAAVQVLANRIFTGRPTPDNAQLALEFENGALGTIAASFCIDNGQHYANSLWLNFERGSVTRNAQPVAYGQAEYSSRLQLAAVDGGREVKMRNWESPETSGAYPWATLADMIEGRRKVETPVDLVVHGLEIIAAMARAERSGRTTRVERA
jgi:predicted dehydrogenase